MNPSNTSVWPVARKPYSRVSVDRLDVDTHLVESGLRHLRGDGPLPDEVVQPQLVAVEGRRHALGGTQHGGGPDRFVRLLGVPRTRLVPAVLRQRVRGAVLGLHELGDLEEGRVGDVHRVGPHIGDQPDGSLTGQRDAFVQPLGDRHRLARGVAELPRGLLLQRGRRERGCGRSLPLLPLDVGDLIRGPAEPLDVRRGIVLGSEQDPLLVRRGRELPLRDLGEPSDEGQVLSLRREPDVDAPVLHGVEGPDLPLPLHDQSDGDGLHPAGGQAGAHLLPQDRADPVPDEPVEDPASLLGVDELQIDRARVLDGLEDGIACDLRERDPLRLVRAHAQQGRDVIRDRLALAVVVGGEDELVRTLERPLQVGDVALRVLGDLVHGLEAVLDVDAELALGQVPDVPEGSPDGVIGAQVLLDGLRLCRRFDDDEGSWHIEASFLSGDVGGDCHCEPRSDGTTGSRSLTEHRPSPGGP